MKQIRHAVITWGGGVNTALYYHPLIPSFPSSSTIASAATCLAPVAGTISNLRVQFRAAVGGTDAVTIAFNKNGSASGITVTVTDPDTSGSDTSNSMALAAGDSFVIVRTGSGAPAAGTAMLSYEWEPDDGVTSIYGFGGQQDVLGTSSHRDGLLDGGGALNGWDGTADEAKTLIGLGGSVTTWRVVLGTAPGSGDSRTFTIYKNGIAQDGSGGTPDTRITISDTATEGSASFTLAVVSGDYLYVETSHTGTPASTRACGSVGFESTTAGRWHVGATTSDEYNASATDYLYFSGASHTWTSTESDREHIGGGTAYYLAGMIARLAVAPGAGKTATFTLRTNQSDSTQTLTFSDAETSATTAGDPALIASPSVELSLSAVPTGTPTVSNSIPKFAWYGYNLPLRGAFVGGENTTVNVSRATGWGLDGNTNVHSEEGVHKVFGASSVTEYLELEEMTAPTGVANKARLYAVDNGSGKTQIVVIFGSGAAQVIATEP